MLMATLRRPQRNTLPLQLLTILPFLMPQQMLCREVLMRKQFKHPNIVPFVSAIIDLLLIVSKWMPGGDLTSYVNANSDVPRITLVSPILYLLN